VVAAVRPARPLGHGQAWEALESWAEQIGSWVQADLQLTNIHGKLARRGVVVPYRTLHRFAVERCGFGRRQPTLRVADGEPGVECQVDFGRLGLLLDPDSGRRRTLHALIFTAVVSRHMFVWLTVTQTLASVIEGCERAWEFFGGYAGVGPTLARSRRSGWCSPPRSANALVPVSDPVCLLGECGPARARSSVGGMTIWSSSRRAAGRTRCWRRPTT
jgi:hypothetical protein